MESHSNFQRYRLPSEGLPLPNRKKEVFASTENRPTETDSGESYIGKDLY
jgi:hypothetical protein